MTLGPIPIVDLFAGPGGLGEGFSAVRDEKGRRAFDIKVSIEKDPVAHKTLTLRAAYRALADSHVPEAYYDYLRGNIEREALLSIPAAAKAFQHATQEAHCLELGVKALEGRIDALIKNAISGHKDWVLIGGPPCQAYSMAGRSRRKNVDPLFEEDPKHFLYREYLRIIRKFQPSVFVMENVKGMLSSTHSGKRIFERILADLSSPSPDLSYDIRSFVATNQQGGLQPDDYTIESECYDVPQMRHRVILFGVRADRAGQPHTLLHRRPKQVFLKDALSGLPRLRSRLSKEPDSAEAWHAALREASAALHGWHSNIDGTMKHLMELAANKASRITNTGGPFFATPSGVQISSKLPEALANWLQDDRLGGVCQHETRSHMRSDLHRYLFASCFAREFRQSPKIGDFPGNLLPDHRNIGDAAVPFQDRFRVQLFNSPSTTVVSHIAKDGHYYIHPEPSQCRSLTVREAARLQTFPDNYFFEGNRTQQYHQVGNAVPPFLAKQLGEIVAKFLRQPPRAGDSRNAFRRDLLSEIT